MKSSLYKVCVIAVFSFSAMSPPAVADDFARGLLLETLDNVEKIVAANPWMPPDIRLQIEEARQQVGVSTSAETEDMPPELYNRLQILEASTKQLALLYDPAMQAQGAQGEGARRLASPEFSAQAFQGYETGALEAPAYPNINWSFGWDNVFMPDDGSGSGNNAGSGQGVCQAPGYAVSTRFATLTVAVVLEATRDIASRICSQDAFGTNGSIFCIVADVAKNIASGVNTFQEMCNAYMTAAEVSATWNGLNTVHGNVQHVYEGVSDVNADLATHDGDIKGLLAQVLQNQTRAQGDLQSVIQLLNTPSGIRPTWPATK